MRKVLICACVFGVVLTAATTVDAFNNNRKGFILGGGAGLAGTRIQQSLSGGGESFEGEAETKGSLLTDFKIGLGTSEQFLLYYCSHVTWFSIENVFLEDVTIANGIGGIGVTYFTQPFAPSPFIHGGVGIASWATPFESNSDTWTGFGMWIGGGYEFSRHWVVEFTLGHGVPSKTEGGLKAETKASTVGVSINYLAY
jgi:hypothetical protein